MKNICSLVLRFLVLILATDDLMASVKLEAENAQLSGLTTSTTLANFSGSSYVDGNSLNANTDKISFVVNSPSVGSFPLVIRYAGVYGAKHQFVVVNGVSTYFSFPQSSGWTSISFGNITLQQGTNTIEIKKSWGWTHFDYIEVGIPTTPPPSSNTTYEAESAQLTGVTAASGLSDYSGSGYISANSLDANGDQITFQVTVNADGNYPLVIRYAGVFGDKHQFVIINGQSTYYKFPGSSSWRDSQFGNVFLHAGTNTIIIKKSWGWTHIDHIRIGGNPPANSDLVTPNPTEETKKLWNYLKGIPAQDKIIAGVWNHSMGYEEVHAYSGKHAALLGNDLWCWHDYETQYCKNEQQRLINQSIAHAEAGGIVQINWHWGNPFATNFTSQNAWLSHAPGLTATQWNNIFIPGTSEYQTFVDDLDRHVDDVLEKIVYSNGKRIPILFRPFHEIDGGWFWWTHPTNPQKTVDLWNFLFDRLINHHQLDNLIWVWSNSEVSPHLTDGKDVHRPNIKSEDFYPGHAKVDMMAADIYHVQYQTTGKKKFWDHSYYSYKDFYDVLNDIAPNKPKAIGECDALPNPYKIENGYADFDLPWVYALAWWTPVDGYHGPLICVTDPCHPGGWLSWTYNHEVYLTLDELPAGEFLRVGAGLEEDKKWTAAIFPNPASEYAVIEVGEQLEAVKVFDASGRLVYSRTNLINSSILVPLKGWNPGIYFIQLITSTGATTTEKLLVE